MPSAFLSDRSILAITGRDAEDFLNRLLTQTVPQAGDTHAAYAALLTPQGKVISDMMILRDPDNTDGFLVDCPKALAPDLVRRFGIYRLRADVAITDCSDHLGITAWWGENPGRDGVVNFADPRLPDLGWRVIGQPGSQDNQASQVYHAHRIRLGVPEGGKDYMFGNVFPHEINLDQFSGVAFDKGCYVGQEVVSRMEHRGLARTRIMSVSFTDGFCAPEGSEVLAGTLPAGHLGSVTSGGLGLALLRLDRVSEALAKGQMVTAGGLTLIPHKPDWARFAYPPIQTSKAEA